MVRSARVVLLVAVLAVGGAAFQDGASLIQGTSGAKVGDWEVQGGGLVVREDGVGAAFGTVRKGGPTHEVAYFVLLKHRFTGDSNTNCSSEGGTGDADASVKQIIDIDGAKLTIGYKIAFDPRGKRLRSEEITLNGKAVDVAKGRVLLVDLTVTPPRWEQKKLDLPATVMAATERKQATALVKKVVEALLPQDKGVRAYVPGAGK